MVRENGQAVRIALDLAHDGHPGSFEAELEPPDAGEQRQDVEAVVLRHNFRRAHSAPPEAG